MFMQGCTDYTHSLHLIFYTKGRPKHVPSIRTDMSNVLRDASLTTYSFHGRSPGPELHACMHGDLSRSKSISASSLVPDVDRKLSVSIIIIISFHVVHRNIAKHMQPQGSYPQEM